MRVPRYSILAPCRHLGTILAQSVRFWTVTREIGDTPGGKIKFDKSIYLL